MTEAAFRRTLGFALAMLIVQFLLGMAVTLFVTIPTNHPGANPPEYFGGVVMSVTWAILHGGLWLTLHTGFGLVLVLAALGTLAQAISAWRRFADHPGGTRLRRRPRRRLQWRELPQLSRRLQLDVDGDRVRPGAVGVRRPAVSCPSARGRWLRSPRGPSGIATATAGL
jgi:hypothetical protein